MTKPRFGDLSRRERQIMDVLYQRGEASAADVQTALPSPPSYSAVRALLRILEQKGHVKRVQHWPRYVYAPTLARDRAKRSALRHVIKTFFDGSAEQAVAALIDGGAASLSDPELERLARLIDKARKEGA